MQSILCSLILGACASLCAPATLLGQVVICPGGSIVFEVADDYYGTKTWEYSADGVTWTTVEVTEGVPVSLQPEQAGWYRVRFYDADCDINYTSEPTRFAVPDIDLGPTVTVNIGGQVLYESGLAAQGVTVRAGCGAGISTTTDNFGVFLLEGVTAYEKLAHVTVEKEGYFTASRSFIPAENAADAISKVNIVLLPKNLAGTVNALVGGTVTLEGMNIQFPANAFSQNGQSYSGPVNVALNYINPLSDDLHRQMPGMLMGVMDDEPQLMLSYGMAGVELSDEAGNKVELALGSQAMVRFPIESSQQWSAPQTIPLWWFDEELGYWVQEGEALRVGNEYRGQVTHFSWWNCDVPADFVLLNGTVFDQASSSVLINAGVRLISSTMGTGTSYTNSNGEFAGLVPMDEVLTLQVWLSCTSFGGSELVYEQVIGPFQATNTISVFVDLPTGSLVTGTLLDCEGDPVEQGYVLVNGQAVYCEAGVYAFMTCADSISLRGVDLSTGNMSGATTVTVVGDTSQVDDLTACIFFFGSVTDIDGNSYQTVFIGEQEWMAENLKTTRNRDGSAIPLLLTYTDWNQSNGGPGWCNYNQTYVNDPIYGKLYNWSAAGDPDICPDGWHVPTDPEWTVLIDFLGGIYVAGRAIKSISPLWEDNWYNTNESGFSGLPGGTRDETGLFFGQNTDGHWWSSSESGDDTAWSRRVFYNNADIARLSRNKISGLCVRCLRD